MSATTHTLAQTARRSKAKPAAGKSVPPPSKPAPTRAEVPADDEIPPLDTRFPELFTPESTPTFRKGYSIVNVGLGLLSPTHGYDLFGSVKSAPAISIAYDRGVVDGIGPGTIGLGGLVGYKRYHFDFPNTDENATWTDIVVMGRGTYHYNFTTNPKLDTYGGISLGFRVNLYKNDVSPDRDRYTGDGLHLAYGLFAGARYYLTERFGAFGEVGYDMSYLKLGLSYRLQ
jgi:hypothetical protein